MSDVIHLSNDVGNCELNLNTDNKRIQLIDHDSVISNLPLMKLSSYFKQLGWEVGFYSEINPDAISVHVDNPSLIIRSSVFNKPLIRTNLSGTQIIDICSSTDFGIWLNDEIEHTRPDYSLYPKNDYSIGYTSRGCIRRCPFCVVPKKEGNPVRQWSDITEFHNTEHKKIILMDNNFFASPKWLENIKYIYNNRLELCITQGIDARILTEEMCQWLGRIKKHIWNYKFTSHMLSTAWDLYEFKDQVVRGLTILREHLSPANIMVYVLVSYNTTIEQDLDRVMTLHNLGYKPYVMVYNVSSGGGTPLTKALSAWCNNKQLLNSCTFVEYLKETDAKLVSQVEKPKVTLDKWF